MAPPSRPSSYGAWLWRITTINPEEQGVLEGGAVPTLLAIDVALVCRSFAGFGIRAHPFQADRVVHVGDGEAEVGRERLTSVGQFLSTLWS